MFVFFFVFFVERGLEIRERGYTPLAVALRYNKRECVEVLMDAGAKLSSLPLQVRIPEWALDYYDEVNDRVNSCQQVVVIMLAFQRRARQKPFVATVRGIPLKSLKRIVDLVWETRRNRAWGPPTSSALVRTGKSK